LCSWNPKNYWKFAVKFTPMAVGIKLRKYWLACAFALVNGIALCQPAELPNQNIFFEQLPDELGLSQSSINCVLQDSQGFLWIGTWSGLIRYDGYSTTIFHSDDGPDKIKSNKITTIYEDKHGFIWVGTQMGGLFRFNTNTNKFEHFNHTSDKRSLSDNTVYSIQEDKDGVLWVGTENGLNAWQEHSQSFQKFYSKPGDPAFLQQNSIIDLFLSNSGNLWIGTAYGIHLLKSKPVGDSVVYSFEGFLYTVEPTDGLHQHVYQISETIDSNGNSSIWFTTQKGLKRLKDGKIENFLANGKTSGFNLFRTVMAVPGKQPFLVVGSEMGLSFFDPEQNKFTRFIGDFNQETNLSHSAITSLFLDRAGVFWVGTKKGLNKFDTYSKNFESHETKTFDPTRSIITGLRNARGGGYWVSTIGGGLFKFDASKKAQEKIFQRYYISDKSDFKDFIQTLYTDTRGNVWVGTAGAGVYRFSELELNSGTSISRFDHYYQNSIPSLSQNYVMSIVEDYHGDIWIGTWNGGLNRISPDGTLRQFSNPLLLNVPLVVMHADHSGVLWVGTRGNGLYQVKMNGSDLTIRHFFDDDKPNSITNNFINSIYEDHAGGLWIGTEGGLNTFDRRLEVFNTHSLVNEQANGEIVSMLEDNVGKLWLAHWDGITVFDPANPSLAITYDKHDRIQGGFFYNNVCFKDKSGFLLFGGSNGFNIIDPSKVISNPKKASVVMGNFQIFNKPVLFGEEVNGRVVLNKPLHEMKEVTLKHFENSVSMEFTSLDFAAPEKIQYAYMLEGFDKTWNYTSSARRYANYTNLNSGEYFFKVKATNIDGEWGTEVSQLKLIVRLPWWKTSWAILIYFIAGAFLLHFFRRLILHRTNLMHDLKVERLQRDSMEKLNLAKLQFFTNISHEFRTPLTLILGPVQTLLESGEGGKFIRDQVLSINNNAQRLLRLVNQLLDFRKSESGNLKLEVAEGNLARFAKEIKLSFDGLAAQLKIDFTFQSTSNIVQAWFDRDQFEKILFNLLSNAFKHTPEGGKISIQIQEEKEAIVILVEDSGKGVKQEHFESIFQTFFSYDDGNYQPGTGIGLALTKSLVDAHHGKIEVESKENIFSRFKITLPKGNAHFNQSELVQNPDELKESYQSLSPEIANVALDAHDPGFNQSEDLSKLLVIEDNAEVRSYIKSIFVGSYIVFEAENGKEGLELAFEEMPDLIISDVMMPVMDGITLCKELKTSVKTSHIPVILLTARTSLIFKVEGLETGADDYVSKPFSPKVLQLKVRNLIRTRDSLHKMFNGSEPINIEPKRVTLTSTDEIFIQQLLESIEQNMNNPDYSVETLGTQVGMSKTQLYRKLKALTGQSANEFIRTIRLKRAAQLLEQNQLTIAEVTYEVGFSDLQYFRECFKKQFGQTPSEYSQRTADERVTR